MMNDTNEMIQKLSLKEKYDVDDFLIIMKILRSPEGCPWDRKQTHGSIRSNFLEETHEVIEAIDNDDINALKEELGDVFLQIIFHASIAEDNGDFNFDVVVDGISQKIIQRHPHVFGSEKIDTAEEVSVKWDAIKREKSKDHSQTNLLKSVPRTLPALMRASKVQNRAKRVGFDFERLEDTLTCLENEINELRAAISKHNKEEIKLELGDVIFSAVNVSRFLDIDSEQALTKATDKFVDRFEKMERISENKGITLEEQSLDELDYLWKMSKKIE